MQDTAVFRGHYIKYNHIRKSQSVQNEIGNVEVMICM